MERLTKRCKQALNDKMTKFKKFIEIALSEPKYHEKGNFSTQSTYDIYETNKLYPMASKLADYEDAEEQGLLLRLPCKVGTTVYFITNNTDECLECPHYSAFYGGLDSMCTKDKGDTKFEPRYADMPLCEKQYLEVWSREFDLDDIARNIDNFGKTVFLTREEAEKALADMGV